MREINEHKRLMQKDNIGVRSRRTIRAGTVQYQHLEITVKIRELFKLSGK